MSIQFSIITICLNNLDGLKKTWSSIETQSIPSFEWIVIDGASNDGTIEFLRALDDHRVSWTSEKDYGLYDAMNKGLMKSLGEYIIFMNSSDTFFDGNILENIMKCITAEAQPDLCYGDAYERTQDGSLLYKQSLSHKRIWYGMFTHHQAMVYRREAINGQMYSLDYKIAADYDFTAKLISQGGKCCYLATPFCIFEKGGMSEKSANTGRQEVWQIQTKVLRMPFILRLLTRFLHLSTYFAKHRCGWIYDFIRYRHSSV